MARGALIMLIVLAALAAPAQAATHAVTVSDSGFSPSEVTINQGDSVTWTFATPNHTVTSDDPGKEGAFDSDPSMTPNHTPPNDKFSFDFNFPGEFPYHDQRNPGAHGKIIVNMGTNNPNPPPVDGVPPKFGTPTVSVGKRTVRFTLDEGGKVTGKLTGAQRKTLKLNSVAGDNVLKLPKKLKPGRYGLRLTATDGEGNKSLAAKVRFRVPRR